MTKGWGPVLPTLAVKALDSFPAGALLSLPSSPSLPHWPWLAPPAPGESPLPRELFGDFPQAQTNKAEGSGLRVNEQSASLAWAKRLAPQGHRNHNACHDRWRQAGYVQGQPGPHKSLGAEAEEQELPAEQVQRTWGWSGSPSSERPELEAEQGGDSGRRDRVSCNRSQQDSSPLPGTPGCPALDRMCPEHQRRQPRLCVDS